MLGGFDCTGPSLYTVYPHGSTDKLPFGAKIMNFAFKTRNFVSKSHHNEELCTKTKELCDQT